MRKAGVNAELATPDVLRTQKTALGKKFEDIAGRNAVNFTDDVVNDIAIAVGDASQSLVPDQAGAVAKTVDAIMSEVKNGTLQGTGGYSFTNGGSYLMGIRVAIDSADTTGAWNVNFGQRPFSYTPPSGFNALNTFNLPTPTINQGNQYGFIAQEVKDIMPEIVREFMTKDGDTEESRYGLEKDGIYAAMVKAIQELTARVVALEAK